MIYGQDIKFTKPINYLKERLNKIESLRYNSKTEKEVLLLDENDKTFFEFYDTLFKDYYDNKTLDKNFYPENELECISFLIKARENSVSDLLNGIIECDKCKIINEYQIELSEIYELEITNLLTQEEYQKYPTFPIGFFNSIMDIIDEKDLDNLILKDYNEIQSIIYRNNEKILNIITKINCRNVKCQNEISIVIDPRKILSRVSLVGLYDEYFTISFYTHNSKNDIDNMYPFEREIFLNLLKKKIESNPEGIVNNIMNPMNP